MVSISASNIYHSFALKSDRATFCAAGRNNSGGLGDGTTTNQSSFVCGSSFRFGIFEEPTSYSDSKPTVNVFPNPSQGEFNIYAPGNTSFDLVLYNSLGEVVLKEHSIEDNFTISKDNLLEGIYILRVICNVETNTVKLEVIK
jgi:hypothetical protein